MKMYYNNARFLRFYGKGSLEPSSNIFYNVVLSE